VLVKLNTSFILYLFKPFIKVLNRLPPPPPLGDLRVISPASHSLLLILWNFFTWHTDASTGIIKINKVWFVLQKTVRTKIKEQHIDLMLKLITTSDAATSLVFVVVVGFQYTSLVIVAYPLWLALLLSSRRCMRAWIRAYPSLKSNPKNHLHISPTLPLSLTIPTLAAHRQSPSRHSPSPPRDVFRFRLGIQFFF
jgi:hypothetical protein